MIRVVAIFSFACFVLLVVSTQMGLLVGIDEAVARSAPPVPLEDAFLWVATLWSPEVSMTIGMASVAIVWRLGAGRWTPGPLGFLLLVPVEVALKVSLARPAMSVHLNPWPGYAVINFAALDSVVNGSPIRSGFLCLFWAVVLWQMGGKTAGAMALAVVAVDAASFMVRVWGHYHWLSGETAGQLLGISLAVIIAGSIAPRVREVAGPRPKAYLDN